MGTPSRSLAGAACAVWLGLACGCGVRNSLRIDPSGNLADGPRGPTAVLSVLARPDHGPRTRGMTLGIVDTPNAEERFAELLAHAAAEDGGMQALPLYEVQKRLRKAKLEPTLEPRPEEVEQFAAALGLASYLTAEVTQWRFKYLLFSSSAVVEFSVRCHQVPDGRVVWQAHVLKQAGATSDREAARQALFEMFRQLRGTGAAPAPLPSTG